MKRKFILFSLFVFSFLFMFSINNKSHAVSLSSPNSSLSISSSTSKRYTYVYYYRYCFLNNSTEIDCNVDIHIYVPYNNDYIDTEMKAIYDSGDGVYRFYDSNGMLNDGISYNLPMNVNLLDVIYLYDTCYQYNSINRRGRLWVFVRPVSINNEINGLDDQTDFILYGAFPIASFISGSSSSAINTYTFNQYYYYGYFDNSSTQIDFSNINNLNNYILNDPTNSIGYYNNDYLSGYDNGSTNTSNFLTMEYQDGYEKGLVDGSFNALHSQEYQDSLDAEYKLGHDVGYEEGIRYADRNDDINLSILGLFADSIDGLLNGNNNNGLISILSYKLFGISLLDVISLFGIIGIALICIKLFL